jgi:hypothetical protein|uniref:Uncharacterized protein n=1 Tax=viral metagenome TaxID=1070528 RepID=A0A6C0AGX4_9ZZZZ
MDIPGPAPLVRQTNAYWGLSLEDRLRWNAAATLEEREAIVQEHRTRHGLDGTAASEQGVENNQFGDLDAFGS